MSARLPFIAGNWKMNTDLTSAAELAKEVMELTKDIDPTKTEIALIPPFPFLHDIFKIVGSSPQNIKIAAQSVYFEKKGAFTGAVSSTMLKSVGCAYVLVGHSERRKIFGEQDGEINNEVRSVLEVGLTPILCIGETKEEYQLGLNQQICNLQLAKDLRGLTSDEVRKTVVAYEPVWAIGTGLSATPEIAQSVHSAIRKWLTKAYGKDVADDVRILYGGSVTPETVDDLMKCPDIDGALVGGASLTAKSFARIAKFST
jgi:triosephosphate isomerase